MKNITKIIGGLIVAIIILVVLFTNKNAPVASTTPTTFKVGAVLSLTGYGAHDSESIKNGLELAKDDLIAKGINVTIDYQDDKTDPKQTVASFAYFGTQRPDVVVGPIWSYLVDAAVPVIEQNKIVTFTPSATSEYIQVSSAYLFQGAPKNMLMVPSLVEELTKYKTKNVAVININGAWGVSMGNVFDKAIADAHSTRVMNEMLNFGGEVDVMPSVVAKVKASHADAILWTGSKDGALALVKK